MSSKNTLAAAHRRQKKATKRNRSHLVEKKPGVKQMHDKKDLTADLEKLDQQFRNIVIVTGDEIVKLNHQFDAIKDAATDKEIEDYNRHLTYLQNDMLATEKRLNNAKASWPKPGAEVYDYLDTFQKYSSEIEIAATAFTNTTSELIAIMQAIHRRLEQQEATAVQVEANQQTQNEAPVEDVVAESTTIPQTTSEVTTNTTEADTTTQPSE